MSDEKNIPSKGKVDVSKLTPEQKLRLLQKLKERKKAASQLKVVNVSGDHFPLSPGQQQIWVIDQVTDRFYGYVMPYTLQLPFVPDLSILSDAFKILAERHESMRTVFKKIDGEPRQIIEEAIAPAIPFTDLSGNSEAEKKHTEIYLNLYEQRFDLKNGPLYRVHLIQTEKEKSSLHFIMHHIISDGRSLELIASEMQVIYTALAQGKSNPLPPSTKQFKDFCAWQITVSNNPESAPYQFWQNHLKDAPRTTPLPFDFKRPKQRQYLGERVQLTLSKQRNDALIAACSANNCSPFAGYLAITKGLLHLYSSQNQIVTGIPSANRIRPEWENICGYLVNMLPLNDHISSENSLLTCIQTCANTYLDALEHEVFPFANMVDAFGGMQKQNVPPIFNVLVSYEDERGKNIPPAQSVTAAAFGSTHDLHFQFTCYDDGAEVTLLFDKALFKESTIAKLAAVLERFVTAALDQPELAIGQLGFLSDSEYAVIQAFKKEKPVPAPPKSVEQSSVAPAQNFQANTPKTKQLQAIWEEVLQTDMQSAGDQFFDVGGHSLKAGQMLARIYRKMDIDIGLGEFFANPTFQALADLLDQKTETSRPNSIPKLAKQPHYALSHAQKRLWVTNQLEKNSAAYNVPLVYHIEGELDVDVLQNVFQLIVQRHESLRTVFKMVDGEVRQMVLSELPIQFEIQDLSGVELDDKTLNALVSKESLQVFDLTNGPLFAFKIVKKTEAHHLLFLTLHHIICDAWSLGILFTEMMRGYRLMIDGTADPLGPPPPLQYTDYAAWHNQQLEERPELKAFWINELHLPLPVLNFPGTSRPETKTSEGGVHYIYTDNTLRSKIKELCTSLSVTPFVFVQTAFLVLIHRYTAAKDIVLGTVTAGRVNEQLENQIGYYINNLALRHAINGEQPFLELLKTVNKTTLDAFDHQFFPFDLIANTLTKDRDASRSPIFDVGLTWQNTETMDKQEAKQEKFKIYPMYTDQTFAKYDLWLQGVEQADKMVFGFEYNSNIFEKSWVENLANNFLSTLTQLSNNQNTNCNQLNLIFKDRDSYTAKVDTSFEFDF